MKLIKAFLYSILIVSICWSAAIFFGPSFVKKFIHDYSDGILKVHSVEITPLLNIKANRVEVKSHFKNLAHETELSILAIEVDFNIFKPNPSFNISTGPILAERYGNLGSTSISVTAPNLFSWKNADVNMVFNHYTSEDFINFESLRFKSILSGGLDALERGSFQISDLSIGRGSFFDKIIEGRINRIELLQPISRQENEIKFSLQKAYTGFSGTLAENAEVKIINNYGNLLFAAKVKKVEHQESETELKQLGIEININSLRETKDSSVHISIEKIKRPSFVFGLSLDDLGFKSSVSTLGALGSVKFSGFSASSNSLPIAKIDGGNFSFNLKPEWRDDHLNFLLKIKGNVTATPSVRTNVSSSVALHPYLLGNELFVCRLFYCRLRAADASIEISVGDQSASVLLKCMSFECSSEHEVREIYVQDSLEFFDNLRITEIISPIPFVYVYSEVLRGTADLSGHRINFND